MKANFQPFKKLTKKEFDKLSTTNQDIYMSKLSFDEQKKYYKKLAQKQKSLYYKQWNDNYNSKKMPKSKNGKSDLARKTNEQIKRQNREKEKQLYLSGQKRLIGRRTYNNTYDTRDILTRGVENNRFKGVTFNETKTTNMELLEAVINNFNTYLVPHFNYRIEITVPISDIDARSCYDGKYLELMKEFNKLAKGIEGTSISNATAMLHSLTDDIREESTSIKTLMNRIAYLIYLLKDFIPNHFTKNNNVELSHYINIVYYMELM